jgi:hypothetical protein
MRKLTLAKFQTLLRENGTYDKFIDRLREASMKFPSHCEGSVTYPFLYDMVYIRVIVSLEIQIIFKGADRVSKILEIRQISVDDYIEMCTRNNKEFESIYSSMIECIRRGKPTI